MKTIKFIGDPCLIDMRSKHLYSAVYLKQNKWKIYNSAHYRILNKKSAQSLIDEVASEKHVKKEKIKIVKMDSCIFKIYNFKESN